MKIVFFGNPEFCLNPLLSLYNSKYKLVSVVTNIDRKSGRGLKLKSSFVKKKSLELNIPIIETDNVHSKALIQKLKKIDADLFVVVAFSILPDSIISIPKYGAINIHPSLLPKYRGASPIQYAILNGDNQTGVSIISLNNKIDAGNILAQEKFSIDKNSNFGQIHDKLGLLGARMLIKVIDDICLHSVIEIKQQESNKSLAPKIKKDDLRIKPIEWDNKNTFNKIRAFDPYPGAYSYLNNKRIKFFDCLLSNQKATKNGVLIINNKSLFVSNNFKLIKIGSVHLEGKKRVLASEFLKTLQNKEYILE